MLAVEPLPLWVPNFDSAGHKCLNEAGWQKNLRLGRSSGAVLNQLLASRTCQFRLLPTFLSLSTIPPHSTLRAALRAKHPYCEFLRSISQ
jgi:hypothetical protein